MRDVVELTEAPVETNGLTEVGNYTIQADGAMFRILIDGLYSDKPRAVIRELCTNARDSHAEAGILDRPFKLTLPTRFDETFSVRDYGVSLTHDQVMNLYTTVGLSTKRDSNKAVGKFGLGSKVPFAVTDSFTITAILGGFKRIYNSFMDSGQPRISLLVTEPTEEEQGVEVTFSVKTSEHKAFREAAQRVLLGFDVLPENNADLTKVEFDVLFEGTDWKVIQRNYEHAINGAYVKQGCVLYPIDVAALRSTRTCEALDILGNEALILDMPIGSVDITPSRESLSYDKRTVNNILDKLDSILTEVADNLRAVILNAPTFHAAIKARNLLLGNISSYQLKDYIGKSTLWRGREVTGSIKIGTKKQAILRRHGVNLAQIGSEYKGCNRRRHYIDEAGHGIEFNPGSLPTFIYTEKDAPSLPYLSVRLAAVNGLYNRPILLKDFTPGSRAEDFLRAALGRPDDDLYFVNLADVPFEKPDYEKTRASLSVWSDSRQKFVQGLTFTGSAIFYVHTFKSDVVRTNEAGGVDHPDNTRVTHVWRTLKEQRLIDDSARLVAIPASRKDIAKNIPEEWEDFFEAAEGLIRANFNAEKAAKQTLAYHFQTADNNRFWFRLFDLSKELDGWVEDSNSTFLKTVDAVKGYADWANKDGKMHVALRDTVRTIFSPTEAEIILGDFSTDALTAEFDATMGTVKATYPLITLMATEVRHFNPSADQGGNLLDYINLVDAKNIARRTENVLWDVFSG